MSTSHEELRRLFELALEAPTTDRAAVLDQHCGPETKAQVLAMVAADEDEMFLGSPTRESVEASTDTDCTHINIPREQPGEQIDRYKLLEQIGEGGFGTVWMAEQREPVKRRVALKIIKLGMDTKQVIARFEAERQALAMMDHPNIARVLDAGSTDTGRPFFVMEYIKGVPIVEYCDTEKLDTHARLDLFATTCQAIQHAHQKGIIHRDIKPSNVLVTMHDGKPVPKVIDFGIAKATSAELTNKTLFTQHRQMVGTPAYMSPEQAEMSGLDIDTRADIYSLGVLLYELLTGTTPFDSRSLQSAGYAEMMRVIREEEPHKPSTRLSSLGDTGTRVAQQRHTDLKRLGLVIQGDLDWIVMKCLEKDRTRRYDTATGLAADIKRHLSDEPVVAGPPSRGYRLQKFMKRNRVKVIVGGALAASLVLGVVGTSAALVRAIRAEKEAVENRVVAESAKEQIEQALEEKNAALSEAKDERQIALEQRDLAARAKEEAVEQRDAAARAEQQALEQRDLAARETAEKEQALGDLQVALTNKDDALRRTRVLALTVASAEAANSNPMRALLLAREAGRTSMLPAALTQLHSAIQGSLERTILRGHGEHVASAVFSPSGEKILTASLDRTARLWSSDGKELVVFRGHQGPVDSAVFSPAGDRILTASRDKTARLWDLAGNELAVLGGHGFQVLRAVFSPTGDLIVTVPGHSGSYDPSRKNLLAAVGKDLRLWDLEGRELAVLSGHEAAIVSAVFSPSGDSILTASSDKTARLWDLEGRELAVLRGHEGHVYSAVFSPTGDRILTASVDKTARLWNVGGKELAVIRGHEAEVMSAEFSPTGDRILTASADKTARLWDLEGKELVVFREDSPFLLSAIFSPSGDRVLTRNMNVARLWDVGGTELAVLRGHQELVTAAVFSPSGDRILTAGDKEARLWDVEPKELAVIRGHEGMVTSVVYSPSGDRILSASMNGVARLWDLRGKELAELRGHERFVSSAAFSPTGDWIVTAGDGGARVWDLEGNELAVLLGHKAMIRSAVFSPSGDKILTASHDNTARLWDLEGNELAVIQHEGGFNPASGGPGATCVTSAVFSPTGDRILTTSFDKLARIWDLEGRELTVLRGHEDSVMRAVYSPTGDRILTASKDKTARLWDLEGNELVVFRGHASLIMAAAFSPTGDRIVTGSFDNTARIWDLEGNVLGALSGNGFVTAVAFSPTGDRIVTASDAVRVWLVYGEDLLELADERASREFTIEERRRYGDLIAED